MRETATHVFRIDDVSVNTDLRWLLELMETIRRCAPDAAVMLAVSPLIFDAPLNTPQRNRVFPRELRAQSDHRNFFRVDKAGVPERALFPPPTLWASHGLVHVDHRLLSKETQELSIVTSCSLTQCDTFVPPFNMWNEDTEQICWDHSIDLIKFEEGWRHASYNAYSPNTAYYYLHVHDMTPAQLTAWFTAARK